MWIFQLVEYYDIVELDIQVLIDGLQRAPDTNVVLEFDGHSLLGESLEEAG